MIDAFGRAHYVRYDESSATRLADIAEAVRQDYGGDLRRLATGDIKGTVRLLKQFKGIGDTGGDVFLREVQDVWTWVRPYFDKRATSAARQLGLPSDPEKLGALSPRRNAALSAALVRVSLDDEVRDTVRPRIRIGTSGWSYDHWADVLYPPKLPVAKRLARYVEEFDTVELNASFYRWPKDSTFTGWRERLPAGFTMSVKAHRGLTHYRRLGTPEPWVERFERCWTALGERREALLVQLHPGMARDDGRLGYFLTAMPEWIPVAVELRHPSWDDPAVYAMLERHNAAYVVMSGAGLRCIPRATSELVYVRLHGPPQDSMYAGSYPDDELRQWADRVAGWHAEGRRVLVYFNNDLGGHAIRNARTLKELLATSRLG